MSAAAIEIQGLRKHFGSKLAVAGLSLTVGQGEVFGFLGPNGAGKTTCLKMLLGLLRPSGGSGRLLGKPLGDRATRARVGFLPEHFRFHDWLTGRELLRYHGRLYGMHGPELTGRIETLLEHVDLADASGRKLREYSKGMLQRIGLAQALLNEPQVVFLDEPTSGLDPLGRVLVRDIMRGLRARGTTVFLNSHLLGEVEATCDRVLFVKQGRAIRELIIGDSDQRALDVEIRLGKVTAALLAGLAQFGSEPQAREDSIRLRIPDEEALPRLSRWLIEHGAELYALQPRRQSLEDVFLEVMGDDQRPG